MHCDFFCLSTTLGVIGASSGTFLSRCFGFKVRIRKPRRKKGAPSFGLFGSEHCAVSPRITAIEFEYFKIVRARKEHAEQVTGPVQATSCRIAESEFVAVGADLAMTRMDFENDALIGKVAFTIADPSLKVDEGEISKHSFTNSVSASASPATPSMLPTPAAVARCKLADIAEHHVYSAGILHLEHVLTARQRSSLFEFPLHSDGSSKVRCELFFERLLRDKLDVKSCKESDVTTAQLDLRHLSTEQLLKVRVHTLEFQADSASDTAHSKFFDALDSHLNENLARQLLQHESLHIGPRTLRALGRRVSMTLGVADCLAKGWGVSHDGSWNPSDPLIPSTWILELEGVGLAFDPLATLLHIDRLSLEIIPRAACAAAAAVASASGRVAVAWDGSSNAGMICTSGISRMLTWEIAILDPQSEDIPIALDLFDVGSCDKKPKWLQELADARGQRCGHLVNVLSLNEIPSPLRGWGKNGATLGRYVIRQADMQIQKDPEDSLRMAATTPRATDKTVPKDDEEKYSICEGSTISIDTRDRDCDGSSAREETDAAAPNADLEQSVEYSEEAVMGDTASPKAEEQQSYPVREELAPCVLACADASLTLGDNAHAAVAAPGLHAPVAPAARASHAAAGRRCSRPSVASLSGNGRVADAIARMEGIQNDVKVNQAAAASHQQWQQKLRSIDAQTAALTQRQRQWQQARQLDQQETQKKAEQPGQHVAGTRSSSLSCSISSCQVFGNMDGEDRALLAPTSLGWLPGDSPTSPPASVTSQDVAFSSRGATSDGLQRVRRCARPSVAFLRGNVANAVSRWEAKMMDG